MFWQSAVGSTVSSTVTSAVQVETLPFTSVTVSITVFAPTFEQSKLRVVAPPSKVMLAIPQLSVLALSISMFETDTFPEASN